jgi:hypothetical protein
MNLNVDIQRQQPQEIYVEIEGAGTVKESFGTITANIWFNCYLIF